MESASKNFRSEFRNLVEGFVFSAKTGQDTPY